MCKEFLKLKVESNFFTGHASVDKPWMKFYEGVEAPEIPQQSIYATIVDCCNLYADRTALEYFDSKVTYRQMLNNIDKVADAYQAAGVKPGDYVSLCLLSTPECVYSLYALSRLGAISNFIEPRCNSHRILNNVNATHSRILVIVDVFLDKLISILDDLEAEKIIVVSLSESMSAFNKFTFGLSVKGRSFIREAKRFNGTAWNDFIADGVNTESFTADYVANSTAAIVYTGGTTGKPKGATITNEAFNTMMISNKICNPSMHHAGTFLNIMPPFIAYGLVFGQFIPYTEGLCNYLVPNFSISKFDKLLLKYKPGCVFGVPSFFEKLTHSSQLAHKSLKFLTCIVTGGDKLSAATEQCINAFLKEHGCQVGILKGYGMTELGSAATFSVSPQAAPEGSVGIPLYFNNAMVIDENTGEELGYNFPGEICLTSPTMTNGYYNNEAETSNLLHCHADGTVWIHTGDIGYITESGIIFILDRKKRMIIRPDGHNVWPSLIEQTLLQHPAVAQCCTVGLPSPDSDTGRIPTAFVVLKEGFAPSEELKQEFTAISLTHLPERDIALDYRFIDALPITGIGKTDYRALEKKYSV